MIDRHYYVRHDQDMALKALAKRLNTKPAELVRRGIDMVIEDNNRSQDWLVEMRKIKGLLKDDSGVEGRIRDARNSFDRSMDVE